MELNEIRRHNLRLLAKEVGGQRKLADKVDIMPNQINHIIGPHPIRNIGEKLSRKVEINLNLPIGWLDTYHEINFPQSHLDTIPLVKKMEVVKNGIAFLDTADQDIFTYQWCKNQNLDTKNLIVWEMPFQNMTPSIQHNDFLLIDLNYVEISNGSIYLFLINNELMLKRFTKQLETVRISSDNINQTVYPPFEINYIQLNSIKIIGKVVALHRKIF